MKYKQLHGSRPAKQEPTTRVCKGCKQEFPIVDFPTAGPLKWRRSRCRPCYNEASRLAHSIDYAKDPEKFKARQREYNRRSRDPNYSAPAKKTAEQYIETRKKAHQQQKAQVRADVFAAYGGPKCACCGEEEIRFLTLDHIEGGGNAHGRKTGRRGGWNSYRLLRDEGYPPGYQVLCYNCNCGRHYNNNNGICPHKDP